jgi:hypothetical protein
VDAEKVIEYIFGGFIALAIVLVLIKPQAQTAQVISAGGSQLNDIFGTLTRVS